MEIQVLLPTKTRDKILGKGENKPRFYDIWNLILSCPFYCVDLTQWPGRPSSPSWSARPCRTQPWSGSGLAAATWGNGSCQAGQAVIVSSCHCIKLSLIQAVIVSACQLVKLLLCQAVILSSCHYIKLLSYQVSNETLSKVSTCPCVKLSMCHAVNVSFCQCVNVSIRESVSV